MIRASGSPNISGAYNGESWSSNGSYSNGDTWLFSLVNKHKKTLKFLPNDSSRAYNNSSYGPTFGGGHDLYVANAMKSTQNYSGASTYTRADKGALRCGAVRCEGVSLTFLLRVCRVPVRVVRQRVHVREIQLHRRGDRGPLRQDWQVKWGFGAATGTARVGLQLYQLSKL